MIVEFGCHTHQGLNYAMASLLSTKRGKPSSITWKRQVSTEIVFAIKAMGKQFQFLLEILCNTNWAISELKCEFWHSKN